MNGEDLLNIVREKDIRFIALQFSDLLGLVKEIVIPVEQLSKALDSGIWFDGSSIEGFARIQESDLYLKPDPETFIQLPSLLGDNTARLLCNIYKPDGKPFEGDPRLVLKRVVEEAREMGFEYNVGPEPEFYLFKDDTNPIDNGGYFDLSSNTSDIIKNMTTTLKSFGIPVEAAHHEVGSGQYEIDFEYAPALPTADRLLILKYTIKRIAKMYNLHATFMAKPIMNKPGSGLHIHQSLFSNDSKTNLFFDPKDKYGLSKLAYNFMAGQIKHIKALCAILCPTVNSYKRLVIGYEAPVYISWGSMNRSALIRIPRWFSKKSTSARIELRCPDPTANPYLAFAVMLSAGLDGIKNNLEAPDPLEENLYQLDEPLLQKMNVGTLPSSLYEALNEAIHDNIIKETLGDYLFEKYVSIKKKEWDEFKTYVTEWEVNRYYDY